MNEKMNKGKNCWKNFENHAKRANIVLHLDCKLYAFICQVNCLSRQIDIFENTLIEVIYLQLLHLDLVMVQKSYLYRHKS